MPDGEQRYALLGRLRVGRPITRSDFIAIGQAHCAVEELLRRLIPRCVNSLIRAAVVFRRSQQMLISLLSAGVSPA
jgi:hypothetical protein